MVMTEESPKKKQEDRATVSPLAELFPDCQKTRLAWCSWRRVADPAVCFSGLQLNELHCWSRTMSDMGVGGWAVGWHTTGWLCFCNMYRLLCRVTLHNEFCLIKENCYWYSSCGAFWGTTVPLFFPRWKSHQMRNWRNFGLTSTLAARVWLSMWMVMR